MHSLYEIETVVKRVARYQGLSWGIAEEAGKIVKILEQSELPGLESFNRLINTPYSKCTKILDLENNNQKNLCPIHFGLFVLDQSHHFTNKKRIQIESIQEPLLIIPFLIKSAKKNLITLSNRTRDNKIKVIKDLKTKIIFLEKYITTGDYYSALNYKDKDLKNVNKSKKK